MTSLNQYSCTPATVEALIEAIKQLASSGENNPAEAISGEIPGSGQQFDSDAKADTSGDFVSDEELVDASPLPLSDEEHFAMIRASFPTRKRIQSETGKDRLSKTVVGSTDPLLRILSVLDTEDLHQSSGEDINEKDENVFIKIESGVSATLEEVLTALIRLCELDEVTILELTSEGRMDELFPFKLRPVASKNKSRSPFPSIKDLTPAMITKRGPPIPKK